MNVWTQYMKMGWWVFPGSNFDSQRSHTSGEPSLLVKATVRRHIGSILKKMAKVFSEFVERLGVPYSLSNYLLYHFCQDILSSHVLFHTNFQNGTRFHNCRSPIHPYLLPYPAFSCPMLEFVFHDLRLHAVVYIGLILTGEGCLMHDEVTEFTIGESGSDSVLVGKEQSIDCRHSR